MKRAAIAVALVVGLFALTAEAQDKKVRRQTAMFLKGGVGGFTGDLGDYAATGPVWGVALNLQPWNVVGMEIAYEGSRNMLEDPRVELSPAVTRHGASGLLKLGLPFIERVRPFVGAGLGASYVTVSGSDTGGLYRNDIMEEIPFAGGLEFNSGALTAGVRATYRLLIDEGFADGAQPVGNPEGGMLDASLTIGGRF